VNIIGISAYYHDSAAAIVVDGEIIAAAQEERFTRIAHDFNFSKNAIKFCLGYAVFYDKPLLKFDRLLETYLAFAPQGFNSFAKAIPLWLKQKIDMKRDMRKNLTEVLHDKSL